MLAKKHTMNKVHVRLLFFMMMFGMSQRAFSQGGFSPDPEGYIADTAFHLLVKQRGYEVIGIFRLKDAQEISYAMIRKNHKWGIINSSGREVVPTIYDDIRKMQCGIAIISYEGKEGIINYRNGNTIIKPLYTRITRSFERECFQKFMAEDSDQVFYVDAEGNEYTPSSATDDNIILQTEIVDDPGVFIPVEKIRIFSGPAGKMGLKNAVGATVLEASYAQIKNFRAGELFLVKTRENKWAVFDTSGIKKTKDYDTVLYFRLSSQAGLYQVKSGKKGWTLLHTDGSAALKKYYDDIALAGPERYWVKKKDRWFLINSQEKMLSQEKFESFFPVSEQKYFVKKQLYWYLVDTDGIHLSEQAFDTFFTKKIPFAVVVRIEGKYGVFDTSAQRLILPATFEEIRPSYSIIDWNQPRDRQFIFARKGAYFGVFNYQRDAVAPLIYDEVGMASGDRIYVRLNRKYGVVDLKGKVIVPAFYDNIPKLTYNYFILERGDQSEIIHHSGKEIFVARNYSLKLSYDSARGILELYYLNHNDPKGRLQKTYFDRYREIVLP